MRESGCYSPRGESRRSSMARSSRNAFSNDWRRQDFAVVRSWAAVRGNILARCVPGRLAVASFSLHASPKGPRTGKAPLPGNISPPCIQNELALARYARHASEKRRKSPLEDTPRAYLAREGSFSLHGPLESRTARESCHPAGAAEQRERRSFSVCAIRTPHSGEAWPRSRRHLPHSSAPNRPSARNSHAGCGQSTGCFP